MPSWRTDGRTDDSLPIPGTRRPSCGSWSQLRPNPVLTDALDYFLNPFSDERPESTLHRVEALLTYLLQAPNLGPTHPLLASGNYCATHKFQHRPPSEVPQSERSCHSLHASSTRTATPVRSLFMGNPLTSCPAPAVAYTDV